MRIIAGTARGARLKAPRGLETRPTADRIKESLFSILGASVLDKSVLDIFAGTGALGLEALSRGARSAVFIDRATGDIIEGNAAHTKLSERSKIFRGDVFAVLKKLSASGERFDLVFLDPPYKKGLAERALILLDELSLVDEGGIVVAEHGTDENMLLSFTHLKHVREERYGKTTAISIFRREA